MMAISYSAVGPGGAKVFLKQYKSPAPTVVWYGPFVDYQQELTSRIVKGKANHYAVRLVDAFEEKWGGPTYFQAYELIEAGNDLEHMLEEEREIHRRTEVAPVRDPLCGRATSPGRRSSWPASRRCTSRRSFMRI